MLDGDLDRLWKAKDLCKSDDAIFVATGVCSGYLPGVEFSGNHAKTYSQIINVQSGEVSFIDNSHEV